MGARSAASGSIGWIGWIGSGVAAVVLTDVPFLVRRGLFAPRALLTDLRGVATPGALSRPRESVRRTLVT
ncbi:hypothetical protein GCM10009579_12360 [Streptomyces javensis]|uniref:Uncharacterized protein n=1 Tax=Streptomyces javensis TaxID=114698 RepID=A0ABP4HA43_9ACTN